MGELLQTFETTVFSSNSSAVGIYTIMGEMTSTLATTQFERFFTIDIINTPILRFLKFVVEKKNLIACHGNFFSQFCLFLTNFLNFSRDF